MDSIRGHGATVNEKVKETAKLFYSYQHKTRSQIALNLN
jgi:hypothetical protein